MMRQNPYQLKRWLSTGLKSALCLAPMAFSYCTSQGLDDLPTPAAKDNKTPATSSVTPTGKSESTLVVHRNEDPRADWALALPKAATYRVLPSDATSEAVAATFEIGDDNRNIAAGFLVAGDMGNNSMDDAVNAFMQSVTSDAESPIKGTISWRTTGHRVTSQARGLAQEGAIADITLQQPITIGALRDSFATRTGRGTVVGTDKPNADLNSADGTPAAQEFILKLSLIQRHAFKKQNGEFVLDKDGNPIVDESQKSRLLLLGAIAAKTAYSDPSNPTAFWLDDLTNPGVLSDAKNKLSAESKLFQAIQKPKADIVWVIDESGSTADERANIAQYASTLFAEAKKQGIDFRMAVTGVINATDPKATALTGKFCSKISTDVSDDGGDDRFLLPTELSIFLSCIKNPPGNEAATEFGLTNTLQSVNRHLPREANSPFKVRKDAQLAVIVVSDEQPDDLGTLIGSAEVKQCSLTSNTKVQLDTAMKTYIDGLTGVTNVEAKAVVHFLGGVCGSAACGADIGHGYIELAQATGGHVADICQPTLSKPLNEMLKSIGGKASTIKLPFSPISASINVKLKGNILTANKDYFYNESSASLLFNGDLKFEPTDTLTVTYERWQQQFPAAQ